jgi:hypothetical protein
VGNDRVVDLDLGELSRALGRDVTSYSLEPIDPDLRLHSVTGGVYRVRTDDDTTLVVKVVRRGEDRDPGGLWVSGEEPSHRNYWKREWLAFASGLLDSLPGELRAPRTMRTTEPSPDEAWIWMEDVEGRPGATWPVDDYASVAFDLGTTQAAYATGRVPLPAEPWLSRQWLRGWVDVLARDMALLDDAAAWQHEALAAVVPLRERVAAVWQHRDDLLAIVESAPQTVVHLDFWPANLIAADDGTTVAVDWSQVGIGAVAQDIDQLVLDPLWMRVLSVSPSDLEAQVLPGYASGLRTSGFDVAPAELRRWYAAAASVHYAPMLGMLARTAADDDALAAQEARWQVPFAAVVAVRAAVVEHAVTLGEEVLS